MVRVLGDIGERAIIRDILPKYVSGVGDDCAILGSMSGQIVITTDPVPSPAARVLANDDDPFWLGWLLVTINASDIAASGAHPIAFLAALDVPNDYPVASLERLLSGVRDSCSANGLRYVGGNLREAAAISAVGTAIGCAQRTPLGRQGAQAGDAIYVFGESGRFWADAERIRRGDVLSNKMKSPIFAPISQALFVSELHEAGLLACAMDTSDGLAPTLVELAQRNNLQLTIDMNVMAKTHEDANERPERLWMGWGDWTVVATVRPDKIIEVEAKIRAKDRIGTCIGRCDQGPRRVILSNAAGKIELDRLESERFAKDSWFTTGIEEYRRRLLSLRLPH